MANPALKEARRRGVIRMAPLDTRVCRFCRELPGVEDGLCTQCDADLRHDLMIAEEIRLYGPEGRRDD